MNENAVVWVQALESGEYKQATHSLSVVDKHGEQRFCCLGVACALYQREVGGLLVEQNDSGDFFYDGYTSSLPPKVQDWLGLKHDMGAFDVSDVADDGGYEVNGKSVKSPYATLAQANDRDIPFQTIASIIREYEDYLFESDPDYRVYSDELEPEGWDASL